MIARTAAMTPAPPMQRIAVRRTVVAILTIGTVAALAVLLRLRLRLATGDEGRQPLDVSLVLRRRVLRARLVLLRLMLVVLRLVLLRLIMLRLMLVMLRLVLL